MPEPVIQSEPAQRKPVVCPPDGPPAVDGEARLASIRHLYPFRAHYLNLDGHRMHYVDEGSGSAVIMVHGNPTWSFYYRSLISVLRDRHRVIAADHMGCGLSDKPQSYPYTLETHIRNLERLIEHLGLSDVTLVVHDWGGAVGFGWATRHPSLVHRLVVFNTAAFLGGPMAFRIRVCRWWGVGEFLVRGLNGFARAAVRVGCARHERMTPDVRRGYLLPYGSYADRVAIQRFVRDIPVSPRVPSYSVVQEIEAKLPLFEDHPMLIGWGLKDFCFTERFLNDWVARFPGAEVHRFPDAGHYVLEDAHERIAPLVATFIDRT